MANDDPTTSRERKNLNPNSWGPGCWNFLHSAAYSLPDGKLNAEELLAARGLVASLTEMLPCLNCRSKVRDEILSLPQLEDLTTGRQLQEYVCSLHNRVNKRLGKSEHTVEQCHRRLVGQVCDTGGSDSPEAAAQRKIQLMILIALMVAVVCCCVYMAAEAGCPSSCRA